MLGNQTESRLTDMTETIRTTITPRAGRLLQRIGRAIIVPIELKYRPAACDSTFCKPIPYVSVRAADEPPQRGFIRTLSGDVQIFLQERLAKLAVDKKTSIRIDPTGFWNRKRLRATGLDPYLM